MVNEMFGFYTKTHCENGTVVTKHVKNHRDDGQGAERLGREEDDHVSLILGLCQEDKINWYDTSKWRKVI